MIITIKELKFILYEEIKKAILLTEADVTKINPGWIGTYAFVLAYNDGIAQGLFPRAQRLDIQFDSQITGKAENSEKFKNNTLYINPNHSPPNEDFFRTDAGHDMLHGLTQNIQQHFGAIKSKQEDPKVNISKIQPNDITKFITYFKNEFNIDFIKILPNISNEIHKDPKKAINDLQFYITHKLTNEELNYQQDKLLGFLSKISFKRNYFQQEFEKNGRIFDVNPAKYSYNPTHSIEESTGNIVSDVFSSRLLNSQPLDSSDIELILERLKLAIKYKQYGTEFPPIENDQNEKLLKKWTDYLINLIPKFAELYNKRLAMLNKTMFGKNYSSIL